MDRENKNTLILTATLLTMIGNLFGVTLTHGVHEGTARVDMGFAIYCGTLIILVCIAVSSTKGE